jgi:hypothetical protein
MRIKVLQGVKEQLIMLGAKKNDFRSLKSSFFVSKLVIMIKNAGGKRVILR